MNRYYPDDINIHFGMPPKSFDFELAAMDTEWFGQTKSRLNRPHGRFGCLGVTTNGVDVYMIFDPAQVSEFMSLVDDATHAWHHAQYDIRQLRRYSEMPDRKKIWDTMLVEQVMYSGLYEKFSLAACVRRHLNMYMNKSVREEFLEDTGQPMTDDQIFYGAVDVVATWQLAKAQMSKIDSDDKGIWENVEMPFLWVLLSSRGIYFDSDNWKQRIERANAELALATAKLPFNPKSSTQVKQYLLDNYPKIIKKLESSDEKTLTLLDHKFGDANPNLREELATILAARGDSKSGGTYGAKWIDAVEEDGRIYPSWNQIGAKTGRMSAEGLAVQTIPHDPEYRKSFRAEPGSVLVIKDYSSQEPRLLACVTGDKKLIDIFQSGKDVYISIGFEIFGEVFDKKDKRRQDMKSIILGVSYGMTFGLAAKLGVSQEDAEKLLKIFFKKFPQVKKWVDSCQVWSNYAVTILGRKFWGNPYKNGWERNYQNHPMQGSASDCTKIAAALTYEELGYNPFIIYMHDELVAEFTKEQLEHGNAVMNKNMLSAQEWMHNYKVPGGLETFIGETWASK